MKKTISKIGFSFRYAFKNIIRYRLRSILLILSFIALFVSILIGASTQMFVKSYYYADLENKYRNIDFSMGVTLNSNLRFFSIRALNDADDLDLYIEDYVPFFEMDTLVEINGEKQYVKTMSSSLDQLAKVSNPIHYAQATLTETEVIITQSLANQYNLQLGETLSLYLGNATKDYTIVDIVDDGGLFQGDTIFLNKAGSLSFFLSALNPSLSSLNPALLVNIYNQVYFDVNSDTTYNQAMSFVSGIQEFSNLKMQLAIDTDAVDQQIRRNVAFFDLIIVLVFLVILLVMQTTFLLYFNEKKKGFAIVNLLGGTNRFAYSTVLIEIMIFFIISLLSSIFIANTVMQKGLTYVGSNATYSLELSTILKTMLITTLIFIATSLYYFTSAKKESSIQQSMSLGIEKEIHLKPQIIILSSSLVLYFLLELSIVYDWMGNYRSIIQSVASIAILFSLAFLLIYLFAKSWYKNKKPQAFALHLKILLSKKSFYQYISVILVCFMSILLLVFSNDHMDKRIENYKNEFDIDFVLTNFVSRYDQTYTEISTLNQVSQISKVGYLKDIEFVSFKQNISSLISINSREIDDFFNFDLSEESLISLESISQLSILLPERFNQLYDIKMGDSINLYISPNHPNVTFNVAGFFKKEIGDLAFTNLHLFTEFSDISQNALFVNSSDNKTALKNELISSFSKNMVYILDYQFIVDAKETEMRTTTDYLTIILSTIIGCFILSIFNHSILLLGQMKETYARLFVLGFSKKRMLIALIKESILIFTILLFTSIISFILISYQITPLILISGEYELMQLSLHSILLGSLIIAIVFILTKIAYFLGVLRINPSDVVKYY